MSVFSQETSELESAPIGAEPGLFAATIAALAAACATFFVAAAALWGSPAATATAIDFNAAWFEDFLGPYWQTATRLIDGSMTPAPGYLYPSTLAWLLAPIAALAPAGSALVPSVAALLWSLGSLAVWIGSVFALQRPRSLLVAALCGVAIGLAHAPVHGVYWAQAGILAVALLSAGVALAWTDRPIRAGLAIGLGAALKLYPAVGVLALMVPWRRGSSARGLMSAAAAALTLGVLIPMALMGRTGFIEFHQTSLRSLADMHAWVLTPEGSQGAQDLAAVLQRTLPIDPRLSSALGLLLGVLLLAGAGIVLGRSTRKRGAAEAPDGPAPLVGLVLLAAVPWAAVSPTWPHGLLWVPAAWWCAVCCRSRVRRAFAAASFACGSVAALRIAGSPEAYAQLGLPAWSAALALAAIVPAQQRGMQISSLST